MEDRAVVRRGDAMGFDRCDVLPRGTYELRAGLARRERRLRRLTWEQEPRAAVVHGVSVVAAREPACLR